MFKIIIVAAMGLTLAGCVTSGSEGLTSNQIDFASGSASERRAALQSVPVLTSAPAGMTSIGPVGTRRCHRNSLEAPPNEAALIADLQLAAYSKGADAIVITGFEKLNGLAANCWYVLEGTATAYRR